MTQPPPPPSPFARACACPLCFRWLDPAVWAFRCTSASCKDVPDRALSEHTAREQVAKPVTERRADGEWNPDSGVQCAACRTATQQEVCPACHYSLPLGWRRNAVTTIAMAGARASGKSMYIAVLVKEIERWCEQQRRPFQAMGNTRDVYAQLYEGPLFVNRQLIASTPSLRGADAAHREPLIFSIGHVSTGYHMLVLRDVAGEDLESPGTNPTAFSFFSSAASLLFLFDPLRVQDIVNQLQGKVPPQRLTGGDPVSVFRNLVNLMGGGPMAGRDRLHTPFGLVLAKFDVLALLADVEGSPFEHAMDNRGASFNLDPNALGKYDPEDQERLELEVSSLLRLLQGGQLLDLARDAFSYTKLFAVSALGQPPYTSEQISAHGIAPFRVLDPVLEAVARVEAHSL
jgi:hypothetical protein